MTFESYIKEIQGNLARGNATEHTHRPALKTLLESLQPGLVATNEPRRIKAGAPDYMLTKGNIPLGYVEAKDVGEDLSRIERSDQLRRYRRALPNLVLTDYLRFRWYVDGEFRLRSCWARLGGRITMHRYGREHFAKLGRMSGEARRTGVFE